MIRTSFQAPRGRVSAAIAAAFLAMAVSASAQEAAPAEAPAQAPAEAAAIEAAPTGPQFDFGITAKFMGVSIDNIHFGMGPVGAPPGWFPNISRTEYIVAPRATMSWNTGDSGTVFGGMRIAASATRGDGDGWGLTAGNPSRIDLDQAYIGWKSGDTIPALGHDGLEVSYGRQNFQLGDGMLLFDGNLDASQHDGAYWLDPRQSWKNAAIIKVNTKPIRADFFYLRSDPDSFSDSIYGVNLEYSDSPLGVIGVHYFDVQSSEYVLRDGMKVMGIRGRGRPFAAFPLLELAGEYDSQYKSNPDVKAEGWFAEANLNVPFFLPWFFNFSYRYASFSGDDASTPYTVERWDPMHYGATGKGFGWWYQGIVVGTYETWLDNLDTHWLKLTVVPPIPGTWLLFMYYDHRFNETSTARLDGGEVTSDRFATEWNVMAGYTMTKGVDLMAIYGTAKPGQGGIDRVFGFDETVSLIKFALFLEF